MFYVSLRVGSREFMGEGRTRQAARHSAAEKALKVLRNLPLPSAPATSAAAKNAGDGETEPDKADREEEEEEGGKTQNITSECTFYLVLDVCFGDLQT